MFRYLVKNICLSLIVALVACGGSSDGGDNGGESSKTMTDSQQSNTVGSAQIVLSNLTHVGSDFATNSVTTLQYRASITVGCGASGDISLQTHIYNYEDCTYSNGNVSDIYNGVVSYDVTDNTYSIEYTDFSFKEKIDGVETHSVDINGSATLVVDSTNNDKYTFTFGDPNTYKIVSDGDNLTLTGSMLYNSATTFVNGDLTFTIGSASTTCSFTDLDLSNATCADVAEACGVTSAIGCDE